MEFGRTSSLFRTGRGFHPVLGPDLNTTQTVQDVGASPWGCPGRNGFQTRLLGGFQARGMGLKPVQIQFVRKQSFDPTLFLGGR